MNNLLNQSQSTEKGGAKNPRSQKIGLYMPKSKELASASIDNENRLVIRHDPGRAQQFCVCRHSEASGYYWGHYYHSLDAAKNHFIRVMERDFIKHVE